LASELTAPQLELFWELVATYVHNLRRDLAAETMAKLAKLERADLRFAWAGSATPGEGHYYRILGPTFAIEYDNTQDGANHVHTVWHDLENGFGSDALRRHLAEQHDGK
jgi:hypothetical protein